MAIQVVITDQNDNGNRLEVVGTLAFAGNYVNPGGDVLSFAGAQGLRPGEPGLMCREAAIVIQITGRSTGYTFIYNKDAAPPASQGPRRDNGVVRIFQAFNVELANGAYPAALLAEIADFYATFRKFV